jgi:hypothetical protein
MTMAENRSLDQSTDKTPSIVQIGVDGGTHIYAGSFVAPLTATGYGTVGGGVASTNAVMGVAISEADNTSGADAAISVNLAQGVFRRKNSTGSAVTQAYFGKVVYAEDGETVRIASGATYPVAGIFLGFEADGTTPMVFVSAVLNYLLSQGDLEADLLSVLNTKGASKIGLEDADDYFTATNVEAAIKEIIDDLKATTATNGASKIGVQDSANNFTATTVETVLKEIFEDLAAVTATNGANMIGFQDSGNKTTAATVDEVLDALLVEGTSTLGEVVMMPQDFVLAADGAPLAGTATGPRRWLFGGTTPGRPRSPSQARSRSRPTWT